MAKYSFLGRIEAVWNKLGGEEGVDAFLRGEYELVRKVKKLLELVGTVKVNISKKFILGKYLSDNPGKIKFYYLSDNFKEWFLSGNGKIEDPVGEQELCYAKLTKASVDGPIIEELGGEAKAETTLSEVHALLEKQSKGQEGALLTSGYTNIFYVRDTAGVLRAVDVRWFADGWLVRARSVGRPDGWDAGDRVFSRNS